MDYSFELCLRFGEVFLSEENKGCALVLYPQIKKTTLDSIWLDLKLAVNAIGITRIGKALRRESKIKAKRPDKPMAYLWFIGVDPMYQRQMIGSRLLQEVITQVNTSGFPVYLETSKEGNLPWYENLGLDLYDTLNMGYTLSFLSNDILK